MFPAKDALNFRATDDPEAQRPDWLATPPREAKGVPFVVPTLLRNIDKEREKRKKCRAARRGSERACKYFMPRAGEAPPRGDHATRRVLQNRNT